MIYPGINIRWGCVLNKILQAISLLPIVSMPITECADKLAAGVVHSGIDKVRYRCIMANQAPRKTTTVDRKTATSSLAKGALDL
jgi:hypothetical protein